MSDKTSSKKCAECENELKVHAKLCLECLDNLKNDKYEDFAFVMATLNNAMHTLMKDKEVLEAQVKDIQSENNQLKLSKIMDVPSE